MNSEQPTVSVVVPTRNRAQALGELLRALERQTYQSFEVIVVDDASEDGTFELLSEWQAPHRLAFRLPRAWGSYAARNRGIEESRGRLVAFTDDDCLPEPGWLAALLEAMEVPRVVGAQGVTLAQPGHVTPFTHQIVTRRPGPPYRTCNIMYRRTVLQRLGCFDASLRWYADNILGLRARALGSIAFAPEAVVFHPPRRREWRSRAAWRARMDADKRYRSELRRLGAEKVRAPGVLLPLALWVVRPLVKQSMAHVRYAARHPMRYARGIGPMLGEKWNLLCALQDMAFGKAGSDIGPRTPLPALSDDPLVSVIIVTRDRPELLAGTMRALAHQTWQRVEVIVVDHTPTERTRLLARREGARYIPGADSTLGWARQAGVSAAGGDIVAFTDDDCLPDPHWLAQIVAAFRADRSLVGVQGRTVGESGPVGSHAIDVPRPDPLYQTCNIAYRRAALQRAGGFDLRFTGYFEDTALGARVLAYGPIGFAEDVCVTHRAVPRRPLDRARWRILLNDERRLARDYSDFYRRTRGLGFLPTVVVRWLLGSPLKTLLRELPRAGRDPKGYVRLWWLLVRERKDLLAALRDL
jgi:glycosyltransferase involved in cell wall biosynthesis